MGADVLIPLQSHHLPGNSCFNGVWLCPNYSGSAIIDHFSSMAESVAEF